jgi:hypothetical protein
MSDRKLHVGAPRSGPGLVWEINGTEGDIRVTGSTGNPQMVPLTLEGARGDERAFRVLDIPEAYREGMPYRMSSLETSGASTRARRPTFERALRRRRASTTRSNCTDCSKRSRRRLRAGRVSRYRGGALPTDRPRSASKPTAAPAVRVHQGGDPASRPAALAGLPKSQAATRNSGPAGGGAPPTESRFRGTLGVLTFKGLEGPIFSPAARRRRRARRPGHVVDRSGAGRRGGSAAQGGRPPFTGLGAARERARLGARDERGREFAGRPGRCAARGTGPRARARRRRRRARHPRGGVRGGGPVCRRRPHGAPGARGGRRRSGARRRSDGASHSTKRVARTGPRDAMVRGLPGQSRTYTVKPYDPSPGSRPGSSAA